MPADTRDQRIFETIADNVPQMIWVADLGGAAEYHSRQICEYTGQPSEATCGDQWIEFIHPDDRARQVTLWQQAVRTRDPFEAECRIRRRDGQYRWQLARAVVRTDSDGVLRWYGTLTDIEEQKRTAAELRLRDRAIRAVGQGVVIVDACEPDQPIVFASPGFERMTGYGADEVVGRNCRFLQGAETDPAMAARLRTAVTDGQPCAVELLNYKKDGTPFWNELSISPIRDEAGRVTHFVGVQSDVSGRRLLEEQFRQSQKMEAVGLLAAGVAHDFNNLLTVIGGYSKLFLSDAPADDPWRESIAEIYSAGRRAADLTRQLLAFSRRDALETRVLDPNAVVQGAEKLLRRLIGEDIELVAELSEGVGHVLSDPALVEQALVNLAVNARDAMPRGGRLTIGTRDEGVDGERPDATPGPYVALRVSDTGHGMDAATRTRIFEPFFTTKGPGKGTGLGLAMVYGFVRQSGGFVEVESAPGRGATFTIFLPRVPAPVSPEELSHAPEPRGTGTVLVVEDEASVRGFTAQILRGFGYAVLEAAHGPEAVRVAEAHTGQITLVLADVVLPGGMGGRKVAEAVRAAHPEARVLYVSGYTDDAVVRNGLSIDRVNFLPKPFTPTSLAQKVREVLDG
ncbi:PAS domain S-box protein [Gemmata sp. G18]|uniref:histidine kinase n=1 Tax=Gemmata palustris TaxID=2822762 RepID=A0ABS5C233_9BACT|nr:PAS domain-containing sensor histidine kinase [Gemmata palustris]MBP3959925.1 PAS domain S-box protein [Gemmata palustris]